MKRFEFANEVAKQLITVAAAIITVVIAFYEKFFSQGPLTFYLVLGVLLLMVVSIVTGVFSIGALANLVETQEWVDWHNPPPPATAPPAPVGGAPARNFGRLGGSVAQWCAIFQQGFFALGLLLFVGVALYDRATAQPRPASLTPERPIVWTQLHPDRPGTQEWLVARSVVGRGAECPDATISSRRTPMTARSQAGDPEFPRTICEVAYPGHEKATVAGIDLPIRPRQPERVLVLGDTGCRLTYYAAQACNSDGEWPFGSVAEAAARLRPDLIIHVGDYHYREKPCADRAGCAHSPHGDSWATWQADFFEPARALLTAAPWVMLRGNHENCPRAGAGWLRLLGPEVRLAQGGQCREDTEPYVLQLGNVALAVFDTAAADEDFGRAGRAATYLRQIEAVASRLRRGDDPAAPEPWLLLHQPLWASYSACTGSGAHACVETDLVRTLEGTSVLVGSLGERLRERIERPLDVFRQWFEGRLKTGGAAGEDAGKLLPAPSIRLVLSGDVHMFQAFYPDIRTFPTQLVAGIGGDTLASTKTYQDLVAAPGGRAARLFGTSGRLWGRLEFGFIMLTRGDPGWTATVHDTQGKPRVACNLAARSCQPI